MHLAACLLLFLGQAGDRDLVVTGPTAIGKKEVRLKANLIVRKGGRLTLKRTTVVMESAARQGNRILVEKGGELVLDGAEITGPEDRFYDLIVEEGAKVSIVRSTIRNAGWKD